MRATACRRLLHPLACAVVVLAGTPSRPAAQESPVSLHLPGSPFGVSLEIPGYDVGEARTSPEGNTAELEATRPDGMVLSIFLEKEPAGTGARECRDLYRGRMRRSPLRMSEVREALQDSLEVVWWMVRQHQGQRLMQQNANAYFGRGGVCLDVHLSKVGYTPADSAGFDAVLRSIRILLLLQLAASPLAAQGVVREPRLLQVAASSGGVVLSLDSAGIARTGDSTFVVDAVYQFPADSTRHVAADRQVETQEMDCGRTRVRGRVTAFYSGADVPVPVSQPEGAQPAEWQPVGDDELPIFQAICGYLLGSLATSLPVTLENGSVDRPAVLVNGDLVAHTLERTYPRELAIRGIGGTVLVRLQITAEGDVVPASVRVLWATQAEFAAPALAMARRMRFRPARKDGRDIAVWATMPLSFGMRQPGPPQPR